MNIPFSCESLCHGGLMMLQSHDDVQSLADACAETESINGEWAFFGVGQGADAVFLSAACPWASKHIHMFDTFWAFPEDVFTRDIEIEKNTPFNPCNIQALIYLLTVVHKRTLHLHAGPFNRTIERFDVPLSFVHVDSDLYKSTLEAINVVNKNVVSGGFVCFHDYGAWEGVKRAVHETLSPDFDHVRVLNNQLVVKRK